MTNTITKITFDGNDYIVGGGSVDDTAYGNSWDGETSKAPSQNAVYDKISSMDATLGTALQPLDNVSSLTNDAGYITSAPVTSVNTKTGAVVLDADDISDSTTTNKFVTASDKTTWGNKQDALTLPANPTNGNLVTRGADNETLVDGGAVPVVPTNVSAFSNDAGYITANYHDSSKQDALVSGTNIKTVNNNSLLGSGDVTLNDVKVSSTAPSSPTEGMVWYDTTNDQLKVYDGTNWNVTGKEYTAGIGIGIGTAHPDNQGPCDNGFHIPTLVEISALKDIMGTFSLDGGTYREEYIHLPKAGRLKTNVSTPEQSQAGTYGRYWTCELDDVMYDNYYSARCFYFSGGMVLGSQSPSSGYSIRPFADTPSVPDNAWTTVYDGSSTAPNAGIFYKSSLGLISASSDGVNWITISDKNLGATTVFNHGDTLSEANCGKYYQWGNNYGFARNGTVSTTTNTAVDVTGYGPGNYYSSSTIYAKSTGIYSIDSWFDPVWSPNLWGGYTQGIWVDNTTGDSISNTGVLSVNGKTGAVSLTIPTISTITVTLTSAGWSSNSQTVSATGVTASNTVIVSPAPANINDYASNSVYCESQASGTLTFKCNTTPDGDIVVNVLIMS